MEWRLSGNLGERRGQSLSVCCGSIVGSMGGGVWVWYVWGSYMDFIGICGM